MVRVALGYDFTLAVTDAGAVFSFGDNNYGALGHGLSTVEVLPRHIGDLAETARRFVAVAAGDCHAFALTEEGQVYGWGDEIANGHGQQQHTPQLVAALVGERVKLVTAQFGSACAVTEKGELYTWGDADPHNCYLGHGVASPQQTPKRVEALSGVDVVAVAVGFCPEHALVAGADGVVWSFGEHVALCP